MALTSICNLPNDLPSLEQHLKANPSTKISIDPSLTSSHFDILKLQALSKETNTPITISYHLRLHPQVQELKQKLSSAGDNEILSISLSTFRPEIFAPQDPNNTASLFFSSLVHQDIDLLHYLSEGRLVKSVIASSDSQSIQDLSSMNFFKISGYFIEGPSFSYQINKTQDRNLAFVQVTLANGEVLSASINLSEDEPKGESERESATIEDAEKVIRVLQCSYESLRLNSKKVTLKYLQEGIMPIRAIGIAIFLTKGIFQPAWQNPNVAITGLFSNNEENIVRNISTAVTRNGEPLGYIKSYEELMNIEKYLNSGTRPLIYIPSIPGERKNKQMKDSLKAGYIVLAEKPAFANADLGKEFLKDLDEESKRRLFFGYHYQHHYVFHKVWRDTTAETFGKIKHIRTFFSAPKLYEKESRIFKASQGGVGLDVFSYNVHCTLRLIGFDHAFEISEVEIQNCQEFDSSNEELKEIDFEMKSKVKFDNGVTADLEATFDERTSHLTEAEIVYEDGTRLLIKEYQQPHIVINTGFSALLIKRGESSKWEDYVSEEEKKLGDYHNSTFYQQLEFIRRVGSGLEEYDMEKDVYGVGVEANIKMHELLDAVFEKGGFKKKLGAGM